MPEKAEITIKAIDQVSETLKHIKTNTAKSMKQVENSVKETSKTFNWLKSTMIAAAAGFGIKGAWNWLVKSNAQMEQYRQTLTIVMKDQKKAIETLAWAQKFAAQTPFEIPEIVEATTRLYAYGLTAKDVLGDVGDMAAAMGKPLMQAVEAVADAQTGELERLKEFGITKQMLIDQAAKMGKAEIVNAKGQITDMQGLNDVLVSLIRERYHGAMKAQSETLNGAISNLKDWIGTTGRVLGEGIFNQIKPALKSLLESLNSLSESGTMQRWAESVGTAFRQVGESIGKVYQPIKNVYEIIKNQNWEELGQTLADGILKALSAVGDFGLKIVEWLRSQIKQINWKKIGEDSAAPALEFIVGFVGKLLDPVFWLQNWKTVLTGALIVLPVGKVLKIPGVKQIAEHVLPFLKGAAVAVGKAAIRFFEDVGGEFMNGLVKGIGKNAPKINLSFLNVIKELPNYLKNTSEKLYLYWLSLWENMGTAVGKKAAPLRVAVINTINNAIDAGIKVAKQAVTIGRDLVIGIWEGIKNLGAWLESNIVAWIQAHIPEAIKNILKISSPSQIMLEIGRQAGLGLAKGLEISKEEIQSVAENIGNNLVSAFSSIASAVGTASAASKVEARGVLQDLLVDALKLSEAGIPGGTDLASGIAQALDLLPKAVYDKTGKAGKQLIQLLNGLANQAASVAGEAGYKIYNALSIALLGVDDRIAESRRNWVSELTSLGKEIGQAVGTGSEEAKTKITDLFEDITVKAQELADQGDPVAKALIQSLTSGLEALPDAMADITGEAGNRLLAIIKDITIRINKYTGDSSFEIRRAFRDAFRDAARYAEELRQKMADLLSQAGSIYSRMQENIANANEDYADRVAEVNERLRNDIQKLHEDYQKQLKDTAERLKNWTGLFDEVPKLAKDSADKMIKNLRDQVDRFDLFYQMLGNLSKRGIDEGLIEELRKMGPKAAPQVLALYQMTEDQLKEYVELWKTRSKLAMDEATDQLEDARHDMLKTEQRMRRDAQRELDRLRDEWRKAVGGIRSDAKSELERLAENAKEYGSNFVIQLLNGIKEKYPELASLIDEITAKMGSVGQPPGEQPPGQPPGEQPPGQPPGEQPPGQPPGEQPPPGAGESPKYIFTPDYYRNIAGYAAVPSRDLTKYGIKVGWNPELKEVIINDRWSVIPLDIDKNNRAWIGIRQVFEEFLGRRVEYDPNTRNVNVYHKGGQVSKLGPKEVPIVAEEGELIVPKDYGTTNIEEVLERFSNRVIFAIEKVSEIVSKTDSAEEQLPGISREEKLETLGGAELIAHEGGRVTKRGIEKLRPDEVPIVAQEGEVILPRGGGAFDYERALNRLGDRIIAAIEKMYGVRFEQLMHVDNINLNDKMDVEQFANRVARSIILEVGGAA